VELERPVDFICRVDSGGGFGVDSVFGVIAVARGNVGLVQVLRDFLVPPVRTQLPYPRAKQLLNEKWSTSFMGKQCVRIWETQGTYLEKILIRRDDRDF
jgi:hypothetical protein